MSPRVTSGFHRLVRRLRAALLWCERARARERRAAMPHPQTVLQVAGFSGGALEPSPATLARALQLAYPSAPALLIDTAAASLQQRPRRRLLASLTDTELRYATRAMLPRAQPFTT